MGDKFPIVGSYKMNDGTFDEAYTYSVPINVDLHKNIPQPGRRFAFYLAGLGFKRYAVTYTTLLSSTKKQATVWAKSEDEIRKGFENDPHLSSKNLFAIDLLSTKDYLDTDLVVNLEQEYLTEGE